MDCNDNAISNEEARLQYVCLTRCQKNVFGAKDMIEAYRRRNEIQCELDAVESEPLEVRVAAKMKYAPSLRNEAAFATFLNNLQEDEVTLLAGKAAEMSKNEVKSVESDYTPQP
jgi:hypothetical protein